MADRFEEQTVFERMARATSGLESEYVRENALSFLAVCPRVRDMRVLIAAARPKKIPSGSFLHVSADATRSARNLIKLTNQQ